VTIAQILQQYKNSTTTQYAEKHTMTIQCIQCSEKQTVHEIIPTRRDDTAEKGSKRALVK